MSLQGPVVVIADQRQSDIVTALAGAGAFPVIEATWAEAPTAITKIGPTAVLLAEPDGPCEPRLLKTLAAVRAPIMPVVARMSSGSRPACEAVLPTSADASAKRLVARLASALRNRNKHGTVLRRAEMLADGSAGVPKLQGDPLEDATVLVLGRGRTYPALCVAVGERVGLIGALSVETAARYLNVRDVDGILIGDGFSPRIVEAFLTVLGEDSRFRDLPVVALTGLGVDADPDHLPNFERVDGEPVEVVERLLPSVRLHAFEGRLRRLLGAIEADGMLDPCTGLFTESAFLHDLERAVGAAQLSGESLSVARFSFTPKMDRRGGLDTARIVSRLLRGSDFACCTEDAAILLAFGGTDLRSAHVVARRVASVLKHTALAPEHQDSRINPTITLASLRASDTAHSLLARVSDADKVAV